MPSVPLGRLYGEEMLSWFVNQGVRIECNAGVESITIEGDRVIGVKLRDGRIMETDWYISAIPFDRLYHLLPVEWRSCPPFAKIAELKVSPITSVHVWFDRPVLKLPHVVLIDCLGQWVFNRGDVTDTGEHYLQVVISAARALKGWGHERIQERVLEELQLLFPETKCAKLLRCRVVTEHAATFSAVPRVDRLRPAQISPIRNLLLAGDWTATGWPATMEGAVRSGVLAAGLLGG